MKPFSLDTVLSYRQRLEDIAKNNLAKARQAEQAIQAQLTEQRDSYAVLTAHIERVQQEGIGITELIHHEDHLTYIKDKISSLEKNLTKKRDQVARTRQELLGKSRDRQVMEKLKERQNSAWRQHLNKKEAAILDEIAIIFHNKQ